MTSVHSPSRGTAERMGGRGWFQNKRMFFKFPDLFCMEKGPDKNRIGYFFILFFKKLQEKRFAREVRILCERCPNR